jgi:hypothetical protein
VSDKQAEKDKQLKLTGDISKPKGTAADASRTKSAASSAAATGRTEAVNPIQRPELKQ